MCSLYERIELLCKTKNMNVTTMCREAIVSRGALSDLRNGRTNKLSTETLSKIANYFDVSVDYLLNGTNEVNEIIGQEKSPSPEEDELDKTLVDLLIKLTPEEAAQAVNFVRYLIAQRKA